MDWRGSKHLLTKMASLPFLGPPRQAVMLWPLCVRCPRSQRNDIQLPQWLYAVWHFSKKARVGCISEASYTKNHQIVVKYEWCMTLSLMHLTNDNLSIKHIRLTSYQPRLLVIQVIIRFR